jgi:hypothetical protein
MKPSDKFKQRIEDRATIRPIADEVMEIIIKRIATMDVATQQRVLAMVQTEIQVALRKSEEE